MGTTRDVGRRLAKFYAALAELKREVILARVSKRARRARGFDDLVAVSAEVSESWKGHGAVEEIREQRGR